MCDIYYVGYLGFLMKSGPPKNNPKYGKKSILSPFKNSENY